MSTILDALQKQKSAHSDHFPQSVGSEKGLLKWQGALLAALLVIICLLTFLLYTQFLARENDVNNKLSQTQHKTNDVTQTVENRGAQRVIKSKPTALQSVAKKDIKNALSASKSVTEIVIKSDRIESKAVKKMTFNTQPLPLHQTAKQVDTATVNEPVDSPINGKKEDEIDYGAVSNDLQRRFELALLDIPEQEIVSSPEIHHDGSDLHDMSAEFQKKVPSIQYDAHLYSTVVGERWIKINGENLKEGQFDGQGQIQLLKIQPNRSIFRVGRQSFSLESLTDWKGY